MRTETLPFRSMGTTGHIQISGPGARRLTRAGVDRIRAHEQLWSRFLPTSDVSRLNVGHGQPVRVHPSTLQLLALAEAAWRATGGLFSPFLQPAMLDIGYERSWTSRPVLRPGARGCPRRYAYRESSPIVIDHAAGTVSLEPGAGVDLGGIAKGYSADLVSRELMGSGAVGVLVDIGGDISFRSSTLDAHTPAVPWRITIDDPYLPGNDIDSFTALAGGVATSSTLRRRWTDADGRPTHHVVDPRTGWSSKTDVASVTVVADSCPNAEVLAKQFVLLGVEAAVATAEDLGVDALIVGVDHGVRRVGLWDRVGV